MRIVVSRSSRSRSRADHNTPVVPCNTLQALHAHVTTASEYVYFPLSLLALSCLFNTFLVTAHDDEVLQSHRTAMHALGDDTPAHRCNAALTCDIKSFPDDFHCLF